MTGVYTALETFPLAVLVKDYKHCPSEKAWESISECHLVSECQCPRFVVPQTHAAFLFLTVVCLHHVWAFARLHM